jgi:pimeloyl-ACP methyl ester carboxylesterase
VKRAAQRAKPGYLGDVAIALPDGRALAVSAWGPPDGTAVLYFHGAAATPLDRREEVEALLGDRGVRWIDVQRPGFGASCRCPGRTLGDWARDVELLAGVLGLDRLRIVGVSAGAPYALAAAARLGERVSAVAAVAALAPRPSGRLSPPLAWLAAAAAERAGAGAVADDLLALRGAWPFALGDVRADVQLWHGARDRIAPLAGARSLAGSLPAARLTVCGGEGHFFFRRRLAEILGSLMVCA